MAEFVRRHRVLLTSTVLLLVSLLLVSLTARFHNRQDRLSLFLLERLAPLQAAVSSLGETIGGVWSRYVDLIAAKRDSERLAQRLATLEQQVVRLAEVEQTNRRLSELLGLRALLGGSVFPARIIARDPVAWSRTLTLDRGDKDGVRRGMAVLAPEGVVGQIVEVAPNASRVLVLTDRNSGIDAIVQRSRAQGIVQGALDEGLQMKYLRQGEDVVAGDRIVTSGMDGIFPKGILVGEVVSLSQPQRGLLQTAVVRPSVALERVEEVIVAEAAVRAAQGSP